jgi:hypothetical protein
LELKVKVKVKVEVKVKVNSHRFAMGSAKRLPQVLPLAN